MVEWITSDSPVDYPEAVTWMEAHVDAITRGDAGEAVWLLEHPPLFTAGNAASPGETAAALPFPVFRTGRGGRVTYHGPGQRILYLMLDLNRRGRDIRRFIALTEQWIIDSLSDLGVSAFRCPPHTGVWANAAGDEMKIAAIGFRVRRWVTFHGISINVNCDLTHYDSIVPCGIRGKGITSLAACGSDADMADLDTALLQRFERCLGNEGMLGCRAGEIRSSAVETAASFE